MIQEVVSGTLMLKAGSRDNQDFSKFSVVFRGPEAVFTTIRKAKLKIFDTACLVLTLMGEYRFSRALVNENLSFITRPLYIIPISSLELYAFLEMRHPDLIVYFTTQSESLLLVLPELVRACEVFRELISVYIVSE